MSQPLLSIRDLKIKFPTRRGVVHAVEGISLDIQPGETFGLVGESGCGKTVTSLAIMGAVAETVGQVSGEIEFKQQNLLKLSRKEMNNIRGSDIAMIFQDPGTALNPVFKIGTQIEDIIKVHQKKSGLKEKEIRERAVELLKLVQIPDPESVLDRYPHQLSGGMKQRVMIAMALSCQPSLLIADEPTTALDVTIQAQILRLMNELKKKIGSAILIITHNLAVVAKVCDRVAVMYAGTIVERGNVKEIFNNPHHPYTIGLLAALPSEAKGTKRLQGIKGEVPDFMSPMTGCRFASRCFRADHKCKSSIPQARSWTDKQGNPHVVYCFNPGPKVEGVRE